MRKRTGILLVLMALAVITFVDRLCIAVASTRIQDELRIPTDRWGWVLGAFILSYGLFGIPVGALGDRIGQRKVLASVVAWWSLFTGLTGAVRSFWQLTAMSFLFGAGEAGAYPNASGVITRWFPKSERARAQGFIWAASRLGGALSPLVVVPLMMHIGWRPTFWVLAVAGFLWAVTWLTWFHDVCEEQPGITPEEVAEIRSSTDGSSAEMAGVRWRDILRNRQTWIICAMYWCYAWGSWFYFSWFPTYLVRGVGFTLREMGIFAAFPFLLGVLGNIAGGFTSDRLASRYGLRIGRNVFACVTLVASSLLILGMSLSQSKVLILSLASLAFGITDLMLPAAWALCLDVGKRHAGVVTALMNTAGQFSGFVCAILFGYVVKGTGSYRAPLWIISGMILVSAGLFALIDPTRPLVKEVDSHLASKA